MTVATSQFNLRLERRRLWGKVFAAVCVVFAAVGIIALGVLLVAVVNSGWQYVSWDFLTSLPSVLDPASSGIYVALIGSLWLIAITAAASIPIGVSAAIYLEEYAPQNRLTRFIDLNIANLAGVPSIVYGILGLAVFTRGMQLGLSVLAGGLTLALLVLPVVIISSREALKAVPSSIRYASYALGATRWQTIRAHVLPSALPGVMTGVILALSRALGEAAPLIMLGALMWVDRAPHHLTDCFTAMPIQIYNWVDMPDPVFQNIAAAGIIVLLGVLIPMNAVAVAVRAWQQRK